MILAAWQDIARPPLSKSPVAYNVTELPSLKGHSIIHVVLTDTDDTN